MGGGGFGWKGKAEPPGLVDQPSDYRTSVPVHRRNPRLARVQRGLLVYKERSPHEWESSSRFYFLVLSRPRRDNASFSLGLQETSICCVPFLVAGVSHRLRTNLSFTPSAPVYKPSVETHDTPPPTQYFLQLRHTLPTAPVPSTFVERLVPRSALSSPSTPCPPLTCLLLVLQKLHLFKPLTVGVCGGKLDLRILRGRPHSRHLSKSTPRYGDYRQKFETSIIV